ncbi:ABC transporter permease [Ornithinibacillus halophilus]|uniref:ABC-2 type transport system permease protein n=1 Tax=Ornithinibacillus halophilus TaxID=930117 RepID=A0A1M5J1S7_9BACI|nr:ABC transporter permease [Ornithinibacillus halophilus]SHG34492.1 ABC-2 type transport system permease protein [Ornithinibacillus halophilus]
MDFLKHVFLFSTNNVLQLRRKWLTLPLLLLFPIVILGLLITIIISFMNPSESEPIPVALIDLDETEETKMVIELMEETSLLGDYIHMKHMTEIDAEQAMKDNEVVSYIVFPNSFTEKLYTGESVTLSVVGNPNHSTESYLIKELVDSISRHISVSQASILTINRYAKQLPIDQETRSDYLFEQFKEFLFYTLGKDRVLKEDEVNNQATVNPTLYFGLGAWFMIITIWLFSIYNLIYRENSLNIKQRMSLYGVTEFQQILARILVTLLVVMILMLGSIFLVNHLLEFEWTSETIFKTLWIMALYSLTFLGIMAFLEIWLKSQKLRLLFQALFLVGTMLVSGAIVPTIYFPTYIQEYIQKLYSTDAFHWLQELVLSQRLYIEYSILIWSSIIILLLIGVSSVWKERFR